MLSSKKSSNMRNMKQSEKYKQTEESKKGIYQKEDTSK